VLLSGTTVAGGLLILALFLVLLGRELVFASDDEPGHEIGSINAALVPLLAAFIGVLVIEAASI